MRRPRRALAAGAIPIAICATNQTDYDVDVQTKLDGTGLYSAVDLLDCANTTPSLATLQGYGAILAYTDGDFADNDATAQNLVDYVNGGGRLVLATFSYNDEDSGDGLAGTALDTGGYMPFTPGEQDDSDGPWTLVADDPSSPLLAGVNSFSGGSSSYRELVSLAAGATLVAHWSDGGATPLVAFKGNVIGLNFYPPSSDARADFWDASTDGVRLLTNAIGAGGLSATQSNRAGFCSVPGNTTATGVVIAPGTFLNLAVSQPSTDSHYKGATLAYYYQGMGISCDALPGYTKTGEMVGYGGHDDPGGYTYMAKN